MELIGNGFDELKDNAWSIWLVEHEKASAWLLKHVLYHDSVSSTAIQYREFPKLAIVAKTWAIRRRHFMNSVFVNPGIIASFVIAANVSGIFFFNYISVTYNMLLLHRILILHNKTSHKRLIIQHAKFLCACRRISRIFIYGECVTEVCEAERNWRGKSS